MEALADDCVGISDIALLLREWPKAQQRSLSDIEFFHGYCGTALNRAAERAEWDWHTRPIDDPHLTQVIDIIRDTRSVIETVKPGASPVHFHPNELYSDFTLAEQWQLFYTFGRAIRLVHEGMPFVHLETTVGGYTIGVQVAEHPNYWDRLGAMTRPGLDLVLSYALGIDIMLCATKPELDLRKPTVAWRVLRNQRRTEPKLDVSKP
jgi:hypothetical protein